MDLGIRGRVALVTGASSGIGKACALALAAEGVRLAVAARRTQLLEDVVGQALQRGAVEARSFSVDLNAAGAPRKLAQDVARAFGDVEILVANGGGPKATAYRELRLQDWDDGYQSTLRSFIELIDGVLDGMRSRKWGRILALTSTSVKQPIRALPLSNVFRTALVSALKTLSFDVARDGITVNAIATGRVLTDRLREIYPDEGSLKRAASEVPIGRIADPAEYAPLAAFLCGEPARYVTGQTIAVDGGLIAGLFG